MTLTDDIKGLEPASLIEKDVDEAEDKAASSRSVGPESEVRGGPEAPSDAE